jgi:nucleotide-binding universal stress UspA family protein
MKKILLILDSQNLNIDTVNFACDIARLTNSALTGVFVGEPVIIVAEEIIINQPESISYVKSVSISELSHDAEKAYYREQNIRIFRDIAKEAGIESIVRKGKGVPAKKVFAESRFADLLIVDAGTSFADADKNLPTLFIKDLLQQVWCPVLIAPADFEEINNIIFIYDRSKSSVFAIKQFTYLFPEFRTQKAKVFYINKDPLAEEDKLLVTNWLQYHYADVEFIAPGRNATESPSHYLLKKKNDFVVMGGYGHGLLSSFFPDNSNEVALRVSSLPIFISHY